MSLEKREEGAAEEASLDKRETEVEKKEEEKGEEEKEVEVKERETEDETNEFEDEEEIEKREDDSEEAEETEEKREDEEKSDESENTELEDLDARSVIQSRFKLVDRKGRRIHNQREGLLLFNGGTVCDDHFSWNSAHAICRTMGFSRAKRYRSGLVYGKFQRRKPIRLDDVICSSSNWGLCRSKGTHNCNHREDILLTCTGTGFKLLNRYGREVRGRREGLLTYRHGTVCDDNFDYKAAHAICRVMGFASAVRWRHGLKYGAQQTRRAIRMDDVKCRHSYWNYCSYRRSHNCNHREDVFLTCRPGRRYHPHKGRKRCKGL